MLMSTSSRRSLKRMPAMPSCCTCHDLLEHKELATRDASSAEYLMVKISILCVAVAPGPIVQLL